MTPQELEAKILYRDALMLVLNKPAGIAVHPGSGKSDSLEQYFGWLRFGLPHAPALAHRLDRDTSGCLILGRHKKALSRLGKLFEHKKIEKTYWAVVQGTPASSCGIIELPLKKLNDKRGWKMVTAEDGQPSLTEYTVLEQREGVSLMEFRPKTGRTHQIRVHAASLGCPIIGDWVYGNWEKDTLMLHLHARSITVPLYPPKPPVIVEAPPPQHMQEAFAAFTHPESLRPSP